MSFINDEPRPNQNDDDAVEESPTKKLRSVEPDLKIIVGEAPNECEYWYHSAIMAAHSGFIDTLLASPMKESISREIKLPDIQPETWDLAMKFLDPSESRKMKMEDAVKIVELYDKYEFHQGLKACDDTIADAFDDAPPNKNTHHPRMLDVGVQAFLLCDSCNLSENAKQSAYQYIDTILCSQSLRMVFSAEQLERIIPVFRKAEQRQEELEDEECVFHRFSAEDLASPMFARLVLKEWELAASYDELVDATPSIEVYNVRKPVSGVNVCGIYRVVRHEKDGLYFQKGPTVTMANEEPANTTTVQIRKLSSAFHSFSGWCLVTGLASDLNSQPLDHTRIKPWWYVPDSMGRLLPPLDGWISAVPPPLLHDHSTPKIMYGNRRTLSSR